MSETQTKRRIPFWLTLSVMANLLLIGLITGMVLRTPHHGMGPGGMGHERPPVLGDASPEDRMMVRQMMMEAFKSADGEVEARRVARATLGEALQIEPYDPEAVRRAFASLRNSDEAVHSAIHESLVAHLSELSGDQRKALAEMMSREPGEGRRHFRRRPEGSEARD